ncbi:hypothetical protein AB0I99_16405 [Streptomyces spongiicola]|uniref:hypothetical protein n=1 Tax=Streptomyces spongiicola TaxID=1690221 RepID=UPI0013A59E11|nr:hypothetical protein [Streptomyces spongiicola]
MGEQQLGMPPQIPGGEEERKPVVFAVRIDPALREQVEGLRGITEQSVNEVGVEALTAWVDNKLADEEVRDKAMAGIEEEERRLQERRSAIQKVLGATASTSGEAPGTGPSRSGRRGKSSDS